MNPIVVVGSLNVDLVTYTPRVPEAGETITAHSFTTGYGGKGANQAVAAARLATKSGTVANANIAVHMVGTVGNDDYGRGMKAAIEKEGVNIIGITTEQTVSTGVAVILVDSTTGENRILITPGANAYLLPPILLSPLLLPPSLIIMQLESPLPTILDIITRYAQNNHTPIPILLNPAPAPPTLPAWIYAHIYILVLNETEATSLSGVDISDPSHHHHHDESTEAVVSRAFIAAEFFISLGCPNVIITLGASGAIYLCSHPPCTSIRPAGHEIYPIIRKAHILAAPIPTPQGEAVDTTAAGDTFIGALAVSLVQSWAEIDANSDERGNRMRDTEAGIEALDKGVRFAVRAAAWTVARKGTWDAMPRSEDL